MICTQCKAIFGSHYKKCPSCSCKEIEKEKFAPQVEEVKEVQNFEFIEPFVVDGEVKLGEI